MIKEPSKPIDYTVLEALMQFKLTKAFVADYLKISTTTLDTRIKEQYNMTYTELGELKQQGVARKLQQKAIEMALKGDRTMLIFSLKNMAKWSDKIEQKQTTESIHIKIDNDDSDL